MSCDAILTKHSLTRLQSSELAKCVRKVRNCPQEERHQWEEHCLEREENSLKKNDGVNRVGSIRDGAKDKCERSHPEDGCKAEDGNMGGDDQDLPLKGPRVHLKVRLRAEVLLSAELADSKDGGGHWEKVQPSPSHPGEQDVSLADPF